MAAANGTAAQVTADQMAQVLQTPESFEGLLEALMSPANNVRSQAEAVFGACMEHQADACVQRLAGAMRMSQKPENRGLSAVLLRKGLTNDPENETWKLLSPGTQQGLKGELLEAVKTEQMRQTVKMVCDTVSELGAVLMEENGWPELLPFLFQCVQSSDERLLELSLRMFAQLVSSVELTLSPYIDTLHGVFQRGLGSGSGDVRNAALRATCSFVASLEKRQERDRFQDLVPGMLGCLGAALNAGDESTAQESLEMFIEIGEEHPTFLRRSLTDIVDAALRVAEASNLEAATRQMASEFLVTLAEARDKAPGMMRKLPQFMGKLFQVLMCFLLDVEDDPEWHAADREEDETIGNGELFDVGQEGLDRLAIALGGNTVMPIATQLLPMFLQDPNDWSKRHAALMTLAQVAEGCAKVMRANLSWSVDLCVAGLRDPHAKVRWAACQAVGQLSTDLGPDLQEKEHARLVPCLLGAMDDLNEARVQAHATAAVVNFSEGCEEDILAPYLDALVGKLLVLLQSQRNIVREGALTALASVADSSKEYFEKYYSVVMPILMNILQTATDKTLRMLRAKAVECVSLVGMAVGKEKFAPQGDAKAVMECFMHLQAGQMDEDDPMASYLLQAWARICKCLGQDFLPYLQFVMPPLMQSARLEPDVSVKYVDDEDDEDDEEEEVETLIIGDRKICIRTSTLEEKSTACSMVTCYAEELKQGFAPYVDEVVQLFVPLLRFAFHEEIRSTAAAGMPDFLRSAKMAVEKGLLPGKDAAWVKGLLDFMLAPLLDAMRKEPETAILVSQVEGLGELVEVHGEAMSQEQVVKVFEELKVVLDGSVSRRKERDERRQSEDFDDEEEEAIEEENEEEEEVSDAVCECVDQMLKKFSAPVMPLVEQVLPYFAAMLGPKRSPAEHRVAICLIDAVLEHGSANGAATKYLPSFLPVLLQHATSEDADVRQCAVYGLGVCAQVFPPPEPTFAPHCRAALDKVKACIQLPDASESDCRIATENAVSALGKFCEHQHASASVGAEVASLLPSWLGFLPLKHDKSEAKVVHAQLARLTEQGAPGLLGEDNANLPKLACVCASVLAEGQTLAEEATLQKLVGIVGRAVRACPPDQLMRQAQSLKPQAQQVLQAALSGNAP